MIRKIATSIDQLSKSQREDATFLATFFCNLDKYAHLNSGAEISLPVLLEITATVFGVAPESLKGAIKPYHKENERHAQLAFLWIGAFYSNGWPTWFLGCYSRSARTARDTYMEYINYRKENPRFKYEKRRHIYFEKLLLVIASCMELCPLRQSLFIAKGLTLPLRHSEPRPIKDYLAETLRNLEEAAKINAETDKIHAENAKRIAALAKQLAAMSLNSPTGIAHRVDDVGRMLYDVKVNGGSRLFVMKERERQLFSQYPN